MAIKMRLTRENIKELTRLTDFVAALLEEFPDDPKVLDWKWAVEGLTIEQDEAAMRRLLELQKGPPPSPESLKK